MKSKIYSLSLRLSSILVLLLAVSFRASACAMYPTGIPTPIFFKSNWDKILNNDLERQENLLLWQKLTSSDIPLSDIEAVVYKYKRAQIDTILDCISKGNTPAASENRFHTWLVDNKEVEILAFLSCAKGLEEKRAEFNSPWYYPSSRDRQDEWGDFKRTVDQCLAYKGSRLKDRYALQAVRALFASRQYDKCIEYFDEVFKGFPDSNLFKRMAMSYAAGCWYHLGAVDRANEYFAKAGYFNELRTENRVKYMAERYPDNPWMMAHLQYCAEREPREFLAVKPIAESVVSQKKARNLGDWEFLLAYLYGEFENNPVKASKYINASLKHGFSSDDFRDHAYAYSVKLKVAAGDRSSLLADLKWFESKMNDASANRKEWRRMMQNIVYSDLVLDYWDRGEYTKAIILCAYADNVFYLKGTHDTWTTYTGRYQEETLEEMRKSESHYNCLDYSSLSFQLMGSLSSSQLIKVKRELASIESPLFAYLKKAMRCDAPYWDELIGTLAIREENYRRAVEYLAKVPASYNRTTNIYKDRCFERNPFYAGGWANLGGGTWVEQIKKNPVQDKSMAKYEFASRMLALQNQMKSAESADDRGLARLQYAIGRRNSFESCWALTQYWSGVDCVLFEPYWDVWHTDSESSDIGCRYDAFLYNYTENEALIRETESVYQREVKAALGMLSDEARAEAEYMLGNNKTVVKHYGNTSVAKSIKSSCDNWKSWL